ncbi:hypothetical protein HU200_061551 [Digitaria exilis]|uniref:Uncharacterized protein n=1 Tax=Digitaria exilis TaxID=1010633 RepID=A0A835E0F8_9POAL|nr:hypothetical protein HU200_061551 [Digitaria exilis]
MANRAPKTRSSSAGSMTVTVDPSPSSSSSAPPPPRGTSASAEVVGGADEATGQEEGVVEGERCGKRGPWPQELEEVMHLSQEVPFDEACSDGHRCSGSGCSSSCHDHAITTTDLGLALLDLLICLYLFMI